MKAQYGILRLKKYKGQTVSWIEAHNERQKESYASNPDIHLERSKFNFHLVEPRGKYLGEADRMIREAGCRTRKDSVKGGGGADHRKSRIFREQEPKGNLSVFPESCGLYENETG